MNKDLAIFAGKKLLSCVVSLWVIVTLTFLLMKAVPGDPLTQEQSLHRDIYEALRAYYGLDKPLFQQYLDYLGNIATFNMGPSLIHAGRSATEIIREGLPVSGALGLEALGITLAIGIAGGTLCALHQGQLLDSLGIAFSLVLLSIPSFILGAFLQYLLGIQWEWLPIARWETPAHTIMPALALAATPAAFLVRLIRGSMIAVLKQDYIMLARVKGLSLPAVIRRHAMRNVLLPLFGYLGKLSANILIGSFIIEKIFSIPGMGYWYVSSIGSRDYPIIMGLTIFYSIILLSILFIAELSHACMDSRLYRRQEGVTA